MSVDIRAEAAKYYDLWPMPFDDIPFYKNHVLSPMSTILELGCGTGRVLIPLANCCNYIHGVDASEAMLKICQEKLVKEDIPTEKVYVEKADIANFDLHRKFDLIIAPYRVFQNLETDDEAEGCLQCVRKHLAPNGSCILNVFKPWEREKLLPLWGSDDEYFCWEVPYEEGKIVCHEKRKRISTDPLIIYPEAIFRRYEDNTLKEESVIKIPMRCYYPEEFEKVILSHGFTIINRSGGYGGEVYGDGPSL